MTVILALILRCLKVSGYELQADASYHIHEGYEGDEELLQSVRASDSDQDAAESDN